MAATDIGAPDPPPIRPVPTELVLCPRTVWILVSDNCKWLWCICLRSNHNQATFPGKASTPIHWPGEHSIVVKQCNASSIDPNAFNGR